ncbi:MAG: transporter substrate-binding domain-containing protein [Betaproteobacteria bacterium]|nr:transporter substrate-binding domain-containing protein [Betaproteobacteria bacterium]
MNKISRPLFAIIAAACAASFALPSAASEDSVIDEVVERGSLRVGMSSFRPWVMRNKQGDFIGFEIDVARALAEDLDVELELVPTKWDGIIPALITGKFDMIIGGMSINAQRSLKINFTIPYANSGLEVVVNRSRLPDITSLKQLNDGDIVIAMRRGVSGADPVRRLLPDAQLRFFDDEASCRQEVLNGNAHAWISSLPAPSDAAADHPDVLYMPLEETFVQSAEAIGLRRGDPDALAFLNGWIATRKASGWLKERHRHWFRGRDWEAEVAQEEEN